MKPPPIDYMVLSFLPAPPKQCKHVLPPVPSTSLCSHFMDEPRLQGKDAPNPTSDAQDLCWIQEAKMFQKRAGS
jgi:hypothetical protein